MEYHSLNVVIDDDETLIPIHKFINDYCQGFLGISMINLKDLICVFDIKTHKTKNKLLFA